MRLIPFLLLSLVTLAPGPLRADTTDRVTALIRAGDSAGVLAALADPDPATQRRAFAAFQTSRADADRLSAAMLAAHPDDPRAMLARGWHL